MTTTSVKTAQISKPFTPSTALRVFLTGMQDVGSGNPVDRSGNNVAVTLGAQQTDAAAWATAGFVTTTAAAGGNDKGVVIPIAALAPQGLSAWDYNLNHALLLIYQVKVASAPAGAISLLGARTAAANPGFWTQAQTTGKVQLNTRSSASVTSGDSTAAICNNSLHTVLEYIDPIAKVRWFVVDGLTNDSAFGATGQSLASLPASTVTPTVNFCLGHSGDPASTGTIAAQFRNVQIYSWLATASLTSAQRLDILTHIMTNNNVFQPLPAVLLP